MGQKCNKYRPLMVDHNHLYKAAHSISMLIKTFASSFKITFKIRECILP